SRSLTSIACSISSAATSFSLLFFSFFLSSSADHRDLHSFPTRRSSDLDRPRRPVEGDPARRARLPHLPDVSGVHRAARGGASPQDRKSTRLNSSHQIISYAVFCLKKKKKKNK